MARKLRIKSSVIFKLLWDLAHELSAMATGGLVPKTVRAFGCDDEKLRGARTTSPAKKYYIIDFLQLATIASSI